MIDDRDLARHLQEGGPELYDRPDPPSLDLEAITGSPAADAAGQPRRRARRTWQLPPFLVAGGAAACLAVGLLAGATLLGPADPQPSPRASASTPSATSPAATTVTTPPATVLPPGRQVTLARFGDRAPTTAAAEASVFTAAGGRTVELQVHGLAQPRRGQFYELWILGPRSRMISLGIVRVDATGSATVDMPVPVSLRRFPVFDLSLEPGDGNPKHSGDSLLRSSAIA